MASLTDMLTSQSFGQQDAVPQAVQGVQTGVQLAMQKEQIDQTRQNIENQKQQIKTAQFDKIMGVIEKAAAEQNPKRSKMLMQYAQKVGDQFGMPISDASVEDVVGDPETKRATMMVIAKGLFKNASPEEIDKIATTWANEIGVKDALNAQLHVLESENKIEAAKANNSSQQNQDFAKFANEQLKQLRQNLNPHLDAQAQIRNANGLLEEAVKNKNLAAFKSALTSIAKNVTGSGALSDEEFNRIAQNNGIGGFIQKVKNDWVVGGINLDKAKEVRAMIPILAKTIDNKIKMDVESFTRNAAPNAAAYGKTAEDLNKIVMPSQFLAPTIKAPQKTPQQKYNEMAALIEANIADPEQKKIKLEEARKKAGL